MPTAATKRRLPSLEQEPTRLARATNVDLAWQRWKAKPDWPPSSNIVTLSGTFRAVAREIALLAGARDVHWLSNTLSESAARFCEGWRILEDDIAQAKSTRFKSLMMTVSGMRELSDDLKSSELASFLELSRKQIRVLLRKENWYRRRLVDRFVLWLLWDVAAAGGSLRLDKNDRTGSLLTALNVLRPHLPPGFIQMQPSMSRLASLKASASKHQLDEK